MAFYGNRARTYNVVEDVNDYKTAKAAYEAEQKRQEKSSSWGGFGRMLGSIGGGLLGLALAPVTGGASLYAAIGAGLGSMGGSALGQQWAGGMHGQRTQMGQTKNVHGEARDIRDSRITRDFDQFTSDFSDRQRDTRFAQGLTDAATAWASAKYMPTVKSEWNKFAGNKLGLGEWARFDIPGGLDNIPKGEVLKMPPTNLGTDSVRLDISPDMMPSWDPTSDPWYTGDALQDAASSKISASSDALLKQQAPYIKTPLERIQDPDSVWDITTSTAGGDASTNMLGFDPTMLTGSANKTQYSMNIGPNITHQSGPNQGMNLSLTSQSGRGGDGIRLITDPEEMIDIGSMKKGTQLLPENVGSLPIKELKENISQIAPSGEYNFLDSATFLKEPPSSKPIKVLPTSPKYSPPPPISQRNLPKRSYEEMFDSAKLAGDGFDWIMQKASQDSGFRDYIRSRGFNMALGT